MTTQPVRSYEVTATTTAGGKSEAYTKDSAIVFDGSAQQSPTLPGPADLLAAAFAACVLKNVERFSHILPFRYESAAIHVIAERQESPPRMTKVTYSLRVVTSEPPQRVELLHRNIEKYGTIYNTLAEVCEIQGEIIAEVPQ